MYDYNDSQFIKEKLDKLHHKGIVLLKPMDDSRINGIHDIVKGIPGVESFDIIFDSKRQVVLKLKSVKEKSVKCSEIAENVKKAYQERRYNDCIKLCIKLLKFEKPKAWTFVKLGLSYMKKFDKDTAIDCLTIATALSKKEKKDYDFTELILSLKGYINLDDKKVKCKMSVNDFVDDTVKNLGIDSMDELSKLIVSGMNIDDACLALGLNDEQKSIVILILARECYSQGDYMLGDKYLKRVEKIKNKTKYVISLLEEIRKNKKFYQNRKDEFGAQSLLTIKTLYKS